MPGRTETLSNAALWRLFCELCGRFVEAQREPRYRRRLTLDPASDLDTIRRSHDPRRAMDFLIATSFYFATKGNDAN